jgi:hypothetical protein
MSQLGYDRFHVMDKFNEALGEIRANEGRCLQPEERDETPKQSRWCLLKRLENVDERQAVKLSELLRTNLRIARSYPMREVINRFWEYMAAHSVGVFSTALPLRFHHANHGRVTISPRHARYDAWRLVARHGKHSATYARYARCLIYVIACIHCTRSPSNCCNIYVINHTGAIYYMSCN